MGTSAIIKFKENKFVSVYSHYDGYKEGMAHKLFDAIKLSDTPSVLRIGEQSLFNCFIGANARTVRCEAPDANIGANYEYEISKDKVRIIHSRGLGEVSSTGYYIDDFVNEWLFMDMRNMIKYVEKNPGSYTAKVAKEYIDYIRSEYEPVLMLRWKEYENRTGAETLTLSHAQELKERLEETIQKYGEGNPNVPAMKEKLEQINAKSEHLETIRGRMLMHADHLESMIDQHIVVEGDNNA